MSTAFRTRRIELPNLQADNELEIVAECRYMHTGEGLHRFTDPVDGRVYLYTQFETADAQRVYACFDQPDLKTTFELDVDAPADWQVVSVDGARRVPDSSTMPPTRRRPVIGISRPRRRCRRTSRR